MNFQADIVELGQVLKIIDENFDLKILIKAENVSILLFLIKTIPI